MSYPLNAQNPKEYQISVSVSISKDLMDQNECNSYLPQIKQFMNDPMLRSNVQNLGGKMYYNISCTEKR